VLLGRMEGGKKYMMGGGRMVRVISRKIFILQ
jgi:hypothetical protein